MRIILTIILITFSTQVYSNHPYNVPPRILSYCEQGYIGYEYSPLKERKCRKLWGQFTRELILQELDFFQ